MSVLDIKEWLKEWRHTHDIDGNPLDKNGYGKSLLNKQEGRCYVCGIGGDLARHEIFEGKNRKTSKAMGFWVNVCPNCHETCHKDHRVAKELKKACQIAFERKHTREEFMALIGRNYL